MARMSKVLIFTEGGEDIGFGHITRCLSLCQAFESAGVKAQMVVKGKRLPVELFDNADFRIMDWIERADEFAGSPDIVIIDSYLASLEVYLKFSRRKNIKLAVIDDYKRLNYPPSIIINPSLYGGKIDYGPSDATVLAGREYIILRREFWDVEEKIINKNVKNILVTLGGTNESRRIYPAIEGLNREYGLNISYVNPAEGILPAVRIKALMAGADIAISGGGQTIYELARAGLPAIAVCFAQNQLANLNAAGKEGIVDFVGWYDQRDLSFKLKEALGRLFSYELRREMSRKGRECVDGRGAKNIVKRLLESAVVNSSDAAMQQ